MRELNPFCLPTVIPLPLEEIPILPGEITKHEAWLLHGHAVHSIPLTPLSLLTRNRLAAKVERLQKAQEEAPGQGEALPSPQVRLVTLLSGALSFTKGNLKTSQCGGAWRTQLVKLVTLDLGILNSSPTLGGGGGGE